MFGNAVFNHSLNTNIGVIRLFSHNEKKQDDMRHEFQTNMAGVADEIKFLISDVRDLSL